ALSELRLAAAKGIGGAFAHDLECPLRRHFLSVAIGGSILRADLAPIALQLLADHHGVGGPHTLAKLGLGDADRHGLVRRDDDPGVDLLDSGLARPSSAFRTYNLSGSTLWHPEADNERAGGSRSVGQKITARQAGFIGIVGTHQSLPCDDILAAASRIALRTRW